MREAVSDSSTLIHLAGIGGHSVTEMKIEIPANVAEFTPNFRDSLLRNFFIMLTFISGAGFVFQMLAVKY